MKNKLYILLIAVAVLFSACEEDYLEKLPPLDMSNEATLSSYSGLEKATTGAYGVLSDDLYYGREFTVVVDIRGGISKSSPLNSGRYQTEYNFANNASATIAIWTQAYRLITRANNILEYVDGFSETGVTQEQIDQLHGECLFLRALGHFDLVRAFAQPYTYQSGGTPGVPIILKTEIAEPARNTVAEVYAQVVADLQAAEALLGDPRSGNSPRAFASKEAAQALLAKVYLYMADWTNAAAYATKVIQSGKFDIYTAEEYPNVWGLDSQKEIIFEIYGNGTEDYWPGFDDIGYIYDPDGYGDVCASNKLMNMFADEDVRATVFKTHPDFDGYYWPNKYPGKDKINVNNVPVLRLSEMYLIRAEAVLNGASGDAVADINKIRTNRGLGIAASVTLEDVYNERIKELCFEGNGAFDLTRRGAGLDRDEAETFTTGDVDIAFPDYRWAMPIPIREIEANENMVQNEGY